MLSTSIVLGSTLVDVSFSIKQNGIMVNLDYTEPINDDDIIGWKSDRGWVYLTLLGVRAPKNKSPQQNFSGEVKKIVIDDFDESTQLAILVKKPILGYDIINSATSPGTIVFIHTEMKKTEVANLKQHIEKEGKSVFNIAKTSGFPKYNTNFKNAFDEARRELGPNAIFQYHGKLYTTNHPGESETSKQSVLMKKSIAPLRAGELDDFVLREPNDKPYNDSLFEEIYINSATGEMVAEKIGDSTVFSENSSTIKKSKKKEDDGWFSGIFPTYKKTKNNSSIEKKYIAPKDTLIKKEKPIFASSNSEGVGSKKWLGIFNVFNKEKEVNSVTEKTSELDFSKLQKEYIPPSNQNIDLNQYDKTVFIESSTQLSDTNIVTREHGFHLSEKTNFQDLQKKYIPTYLHMEQDTLIRLKNHEPPTQSPDTNIVEAWFIDESIISDDYDVTHLQKQFIPSKNNIILNDLDEPQLRESLPQSPEYTDPIVLDNRFKTKFKNNEIKRKPKLLKEEPFYLDSTDNNTWLSFFPLQADSVKKSLQWDFNQEKELPYFLKQEKEKLDYSSQQNSQYGLREQLPEKSTKTRPMRKSDSDYIYFHSAGIRVETNMDGVPIYIDGKYVGDTPITRPIQVEPGWHQVSGFSPIYTHLSSRERLQYVDYDSIIQNNRSHGSTTVYAEAGSLEKVVLKFNHVGDTPKKLSEIKGGMSIGLPMFTFLISMVFWTM